MRRELKIALMLFLISCTLILLAHPTHSVSQTSDGSVDGSGIPNEIEPPVNSPIGPAGNTGAEYKFDIGFYQKIQDLIQDEPREGEPGVYDGERYYNVIMVVSRDDGDDRNPDETARENKDAIVKRLELLGAHNITAAGSLSFVTASIPVADVPGFSLHEELYSVGDGESPVAFEVDTARRTIHATAEEISTAAGSSLNGTGVIVAVIDTDINHRTALNPKVLKSISCFNDGCNVTPGSRPSPGVMEATHGTKVAQVLAASGLPNNNGIAPGVRLLDIIVMPNHTTSSGAAHALDWSLKNGADIVNMSFSTEACSYTYTLVGNEAVDKGMTLVSAAGNYGINYMNDTDSTNDLTRYQSIYSPDCTYNVISVGGINDRGSGPITMYPESSRGPLQGENIVVLKPELAAPAVNINTLKFATGSEMKHSNGTSYAAPQVSAAAAMLLEFQPGMTPVEVRSALLLGADWQGPIPCTSAQYERRNSNDNCSHARQPSDITEANNAASVGILNNAGFGILDVAQTIEYVRLGSHVVDGYLDTRTQSRQYTFNVNDTSDPVKVILSWLSHPHGGILEQINRSSITPFANLDITIRQPDGTTMHANSAHQANEFAVFNPSQTGKYTVTVSGSGLDTINKPVQNYAVASTHALTELSVPSSRTLPSANGQTVIVNPDQTEPVTVVLNGTSPGGGPLSFSVSKDPRHGTVSVAEFVTNTVSKVLYTPKSTFSASDTFEVVPRDNHRTGAPAVISIVGEKLPPRSKEVNSNPDAVLDWDTMRITSGFAQAPYEMKFPNKSYPIYGLYVGSANMDGTHLEFTAGGDKYTVAIPQDGVRMLQFPPIAIQDMTLYADGIDEEAMASNLDGTAEDIRVYAGYVNSTASFTSPPTPAPTNTPRQYSETTASSLSIPDNTGRQDTSSHIHIMANGTIKSLSVSVDISHTYRGDLKVILTSPNGTETALHDRSGGPANDIRQTYSSESHAGLGALVGGQTAGRWTLSVGDYAGGDVGTLNSWSLVIKYDPVTPTPPKTSTGIIFSEDFESGLADKWAETGDGDWTIATSRQHSVPILPGHNSTNRVLHSDDCDRSCTLTLKNPIDLSGYESATLSFWRFVDSGLDRGEYLKVELYDGSTWNTIRNWTDKSGDNNTWTSETCSLDSYTVSEFRMRLVTRQTLTSEDVQVDNIVISSSTDDSAQSCGPASTYTARTDTAPVISAISNVSLSHAQTRTITVSATDRENDSIRLSLTVSPSFVTLSGNTITINPGSSDVGSHSVTVTATANGKTDTESFTVTVTPASPPRDTTPPSITAPSDKTFEATATSTPVSAVRLGTATATDDRDRSPAITSNAPSTFPLGRTTVTWTATDDAGNSSTDTQYVTIRDTTAPRFASTPSGISKTVSGSTSTITYSTPRATDIFRVTVSCTPASGSTFSLGTTTVTCTATDASSNTARTTFVVTISKPAVTAPSVPQSVSAGTTTTSSVKLSWSAPSSNGGSAITDYTIQYKKSTSGTWTTFSDGTSTTVSATVTGLSANTAYKFRVAGVNSAGTGSYSAEVSASTKPSCPANYHIVSNACKPGKVSVSGYVFRDTDRDGVRDSGETGVSGIVMKAFAGGWDNGVYVHNNELKSTTTGSSGYYSLSDIPTGSNYVLVQIIQDGTQFYTTAWHIIISGTIDSGSRTFNVGLQ